MAERVRSSTSNFGSHFTINAWNSPRGYKMAPARVDVGMHMISYQ